MYNGKKLLLIVNPGSTSLKIALYSEEECLIEKNLPMDLKSIANTIETYDIDWDCPPVVMVRDFMKEIDISPENLDMIVARGGPAPPMKSGAYEVNQLYYDEFKLEPPLRHPSILAPMIAFVMGEKLNVPKIVYDSDTVDEAGEMARLTGLPEITRRITSHNLNGKMMARKLADELGKPYEECNFIVIHLGGGIDVCIHDHGVMADSLFVDEGPMTPTRCGGLPNQQLIALCFSGKYTFKEVMSFYSTNGGLQAFFGTSDAREVEKMIEAGDEKARTVYYAMAYQIAKSTGAMAATVAGKVDGIIITGGLARSEMLVGWIKELVSWIAPIYMYPGEDENRALALGGLRVLRGEEPVQPFDLPPYGCESVEAFYARFKK